MEKIDICIRVKDPYIPMFRKCLENIQKFMNYEKIFVIDGYSTNGTIEVAKEFGCKIKQIKGLVAATNLSYKLPTTKWFACIDSDVWVTKNWQQKCFDYLRRLEKIKSRKVGAIETIFIPTDVKYRKLFLYRTIKQLIHREKYHDGNLGYALLRSEAVKNIKIPDHVTACEDILTRHQVEKKEYSWWIIWARTYVLHHARNWREKELSHTGWYVLNSLKLKIIKPEDIKHQREKLEENIRKTIKETGLKWFREYETKRLQEAEKALGEYKQWKKKKRRKLAISLKFQ